MGEKGIVGEERGDGLGKGKRGRGRRIGEKGTRKENWGKGGEGEEEEEFGKNENRGRGKTNKKWEKGGREI